MTDVLGSENLVRLSEVPDLQIAPDDSNPTGWTVYAGDDPIGKVTDLLVDSTAMKARYLEVQTDDVGEPHMADDHLRVPVEDVRLSSATRSVELIGLEQGGPKALQSLRELSRGPSRTGQSSQAPSPPEVEADVRKERVDVATRGDAVTGTETLADVEQHPRRGGGGSRG